MVYLDCLSFKRQRAILRYSVVFALHRHLPQQCHLQVTNRMYKFHDHNRWTSIVLPVSGATLGYVPFPHIYVPADSDYICAEEQALT